MFDNFSFVLAVIGFLLTMVAIIVFMALTVPLYIGLLVNQPGGQQRSGFHLFTYIQEGQVKIIERGERPVRFIMLKAGYRFAQVGSEGESSHWEIVETQANEQDAHPLDGIHPILSVWASMVYNLTGAVFTGLYPWQRVREYEIERTKMWRREEGVDNNIRLQVKDDISDHFRTRQFLYPIRVAAADTKDKISVNLLLGLRARVTNPHKAAYGVDRWDQQLMNMATHAVTNFTRGHDLDEVLTVNTSDVAALQKAIKAITTDESQFGINIEDVDIIDISPNLDSEEKKKLYAEALAKTVGAATVIDGKSRAAALTHINKANAEGGEHALETLRTEALVRAAAATKGTVILNSGGTAGTDPIQAAILNELRKLNQKQEEK